MLCGGEKTNAKITSARTAPAIPPTISPDLSN